MNRMPRKPAGRLPRAVRSLTKKGLHTRAAILEAARDVFREQGYYSASVAEILRRAGLSQGAFYQYFRNKEQAFLELNDDILARFWERATRVDVGGLAPERRLPHVVRLLLEHSRENHYFHKILGEFELIDPVTIGYYDSLARFLRGFFRREITQGQIRPLDPNVLSYGLIGLTSFHALEWKAAGEGAALEDLEKWSTALWQAGLSSKRHWPRPKRLSSPPSTPGSPVESQATGPKGRRQATAQALLIAAEQVIGEYGFNRASIADITRRAGFALGTFYVHFKSKRHLMEEFVRHLNRQMRWELKHATRGVGDRRDVERAGIAAFFGFLSTHRQIYRVLTESETIGREIAMWYYEKLAERYEAGLREGVAAGEIRSDLPPAFMVRSVMGLIHMIGLKWLVWNSLPQAELPGQALEDTITIVLEGVRARQLFS